MFKKFALAFICLSLVSCGVATKVKDSVYSAYSAIESAFVPDFPDVPLPDGFAIDNSSSSFFDSAEGRIAEISASGKSKAGSVSQFYDKSMPQFGWVKVGNMTYKKEGELLSITPATSGDITTLKFQLKPAK